MLSIINRNLVFPLIEMIRHEPIRNCLKELNKSQWYSYDQLKEIQWNKLKKLIEYSYYNVEYYKNCFDSNKISPSDIKSFEDFSKIPLLSKKDIRTAGKDIYSKIYDGKVEECKSGGTQGKPLYLVRDSLSSAYGRAAYYRCLNWYGLRIGDKQLRVWGLPLNIEKAKKEIRKDSILNRIRISAFDIKKETIYKSYKLIKNFKPVYMYGYVSGIVKICQLMRDENLDGRALKIKYAVTTAEMISESQRKIIEDFLDCSVINEYGCGEVSVVASECPAGNLHVNMENVLVESIQKNPDQKDSKEIILTNLNSFSMPLLRYRICDTGNLVESKCACGRKLEIIDSITGRIVNMLLSTDGRYIAGNIFRYIAFDFITKYKGIKDFKVIQKQKKKIEIILSKDTNFSDNLLEKFTAEVKKILGQDMKITYQFQKDIALEKSGKRLFVYSELSE